MRRIIYTALGAAALASASIANAAVTVTNSSDIDTPVTVVNNGNMSTIDFGRNPEPSGVFTGSIDFTNTLAGLYSIIVGTSTPGGTITDLSLTGIANANPPGAGTGTFATTGTTNSLSLFVPNALAGTYRVGFAGTAPASGGVATGNLTFQLVPSVPEPATWALMIAGFAGIGFALRRRRRPALAQLA